ncbi:DUF4249 domain-containing protein [Fibrella aquatilis]|uniref:DUF4249 domain-containing protein n=1 Tax=Fibrella aquatilis TaxID=2817059 RepID=A0A939G5J5_9BACT|nr:DUF4249 domain-containing protein [Fibrella aquatilis]MBO0932772.1 DUF4249 domain-containing protein [Fibrella aquatilis]
MKRSLVVLKLAVVLISLWGLMGCETIIDANIASGPTQLAVDAWLTDQPGQQRITLTQTANYFNNGPSTPATSASVVVGDNTGRTFAFTDPDNDGVYTWKPASTRDTTRLGIIGRTYTLGIQYQGNTYVSVAQMPRTTSIDSLIFRKKTITPVSKEEGYRSEFYATDPAGAIDYYYLRYYRNGVLQNRPQDISLAYDGAFRGSANTDGLMFIRPIRQSLNPEKLFALNDTMRIEMRTMTAEGYLFWELLRAQLQNAGLFATPPANVPSNIRNTNAAGPAAVGFFLVSPVRTRTAIVGKETLRGGD